MPQGTSPKQKEIMASMKGLALLFGIKKSHVYLFGRNFTLCTDHKPLQSLLNKSKPIPCMASAHIQRWALTLASYEYTIKYKSGPANSNADALSRLPLPATFSEVLIPSELLLLMEHMSSGPLMAAQVKAMTQQDPVLSRVHSCVFRGWPTTVDFSFPHADMSYQFVMVTCYGAVTSFMLWGCVIIPRAGRQTILDELHDSHQGASRMKERARMVVWWPCMDKQIKEMASSCVKCKAVRNLPPLAPLHPWSFPDQPWCRFHIDYAEPVDNHMLLVVVDAFSKWIEVFPVKSASSATTIGKLQALLLPTEYPSP